MTVLLPWQTIALRLALATVAGALMGLDRSEHGRPAGLRTTMLVCLAAAVAMIQTNLLLGTAGKPADSFVMLDLMRLPLGILTGMGFIGGGAILRRDGFVLGVTTAATLWFVTVVGLCFGGGQLKLGVAALALGVLVLSGLRALEHRLPQDLHGTLRLTLTEDGTVEAAIRSRALAEGCRLSVTAVEHARHSRQRVVEFSVQWRGTPSPAQPPAFVSEVLRDPLVEAAQWRSAA
jgi:putative Mg2+ transporter-C (MgtC) family protein